MRRTGFQLVLGGLALGLSACGGGEAAESETGDEPAALAEAADRAEEAGPSEPVAAAEAAVDPAAAPVPGPGSAPGELAAYVGKFPFDKVGGVTWREHPLVVAGIRKTVTDAAVRRAMQAPDGPSAPIGTYQGKVGSWSCQQHNCGDHQWAVLVDPTSGATDVCYHNAEQSGESSRWFLADGGEEIRQGNCLVV